MMSRTEKRDIQVLAATIVWVVASFSLGVGAGVAGTVIAGIVGAIYIKRFRRPAESDQAEPPSSNPLWEDAEAVLQALNGYRSDVVPSAVIDALAREARKAVEIGRAEPFSKRSGEIRHVIGLLGDSLAVKAEDQSLSPSDGERFTQVLRESTETLAGLGEDKDSATQLNTHLNVLEREVRTLKSKE